MKKESDKLERWVIYYYLFKIWILNKKPVENQLINKKLNDKSEKSFNFRFSPKFEIWIL
jgi:hypothetical protein